MRAKHFVAMGAAAAAVLALHACSMTQEEMVLDRTRPKPLLALAAQSYAQQASELASLPSGPGAEGRIGDLLMENANVRFVIAAADHAGPGLPAGNVLDAAIQGGEDRMRILSPLLGSGPPRPAVYDAVRIQSGGGPNAPAIVAAEGHLLGLPQVKVVTTYALPPDSASLEIATRVENGTGARLDQFMLGDVLCHGRTLRFVPAPKVVSGRAVAASTWLSFFWDDRSWGLLCAPGESMDVTHGLGSSQLEMRYATVDIPPGQSRTYRRFLMAAAGGPEKVWEVAYPTPESMLSHLAVQLNEDGTEKPVAGAQVVIAPGDRRSPVLLVTGPSGRAEANLQAGRYSIRALAPGRPPVGPLTVTCMAARTHLVSMYMPPRAEVLAQVRAKVGQFATPTDARLTCYSAAEQAMPVPFPADFPMPGESGVALADAAGGGRVPLTPFSPQLPGSFVLVVSKGPLFASLGLPVAAEAGKTVTLEPTLERAVDPGRYVSVDLRQHTDASPDCSLTVGERALADACEGLQAAVVSDPSLRTVLVGAQRQSECRLVAGLRLTLDGQGSFSVYPLGEASGPAPDLWAIARPERPASEVLADIRQRFPAAVIQVDDPLDARSGYFALEGFEPDLGAPPLADFDAVEVLSGRNVADARKVLACWFSLLNTGKRVVATGGSGSRGVFYEMAGVARTFVYCPSAAPAPTAAEVEAAIGALKTSANAFVTNGPFIEATLNGKAIGSIQTVRDGKVRLDLRVSAPLHVDVTRATVYRNGRAVQDVLIPQATKPLRCDRVLELEAGRDCWFVVVVEGNRPMAPVYEGGSEAPKPFAVTNPFWVDADGDGKVQLGG